MLKALLKKQLLELNALLFLGKKTGKKRSRGSVAVLALLYLFVFGSLSLMFIGMAFMFTPYLETEYSWLYFSMTGLVALAMGVIGSVFNTYACLYNAKDNELLLSMPIPPSMILVSRIISVSLSGLLFEAPVFVPAIIVRLTFAPFDAAVVIFSILTLVAINLVGTVLSCILGFFVALVASRLRKKSFVVVLLSLGFFAGYYYLISASSELILKLIENGAEVSRQLRAVYPIYQLGRAAEGDPLQMLLVCLEAGAVFALTFFILSKSFIRIVTRKKSVKRSVYRGGPARVAGTGKALLRRELAHYLSSPTYMLNSSLASIFLLFLGGAAIVRAEKLTATLELLGEQFTALYPIFAAMAVAVVASMNVITAPSVSLEGKHIWIVHSMPVQASKVLDAKQLLHILLTLPPAAFCAIALAAVLRVGILDGILVLIYTAVFVMFASAFGLVLNLKMPNLNWMNEAVPVKQSMAVIIAMFGGMIIGAAPLVGAIFIGFVIGSTVPLILAAVLLGVITFLLNLWIRHRGCEIFDQL